MKKNINFINLMLTLIYISACGLVQAKTWETKNQWDLSYEEKYQKWVRDEFHENIFKSKDSYLCGINTDCADMVYFARAIFSFENNLEFKIKNTLGGSNKYINNETELNTHEKSRYSHCLSQKAFKEMSLKDKNIEEVLKLKGFLEFIGNEVVSTKTLAFNDTLPVSPESLTSGDIYVSPTDSDRHSFLIKEVNPKMYFKLIFDTMTEKITKLNIVKSLPQYIPREKKWGLKRFIWPNDYDKKIIDFKVERGFSEKQYKFLNSSDFFKNIFKIKFKENIEEEKIQEEIFRKTSNICTLLKSRKSVIEQTLNLIEEQKYQDKNGCFIKPKYRNFSTPSRDATIVKEIRSLYKSWDSHIKKGGSYSELDNSYKYIVDILKSYDKENKEKIMIPIMDKSLNIKQLKNICNIDISSKGYSILDFLNSYTTLSKGKSILSSNPNDSFEARWGLDVSAFEIQRTSCPNYD